jgi:glycogen debranching enzyme
VAGGDPGRFHALFDRDSLITSLQLLPVRPLWAHATGRALAARQGREANPRTQEEPGKIGHEFRLPPHSLLDAGWADPGPFRYYGSADATSWFCVVLAATHDERLVQALEPAWRAGGLIARTLDSGGGLLRHSPGSFPGRAQPARLARHDRSHAPRWHGRAARRRYPPAARSPTWIPKP